MKTNFWVIQKRKNLTEKIWLTIILILRGDMLVLEGLELTIAFIFICLIVANIFEQFWQKRKNRYILIKNRVVELPKSRSKIPKFVSLPVEFYVNPLGKSRIEFHLRVEKGKHHLLDQIVQKLMQRFI